MLEHENYIQRCLELAQNGCGNTSPNPMVGSVIVHKDTIIGEGFHHACGEAHAERNAINSVREKNLLPHSTLYVNLEPCAHFGRTPPCADFIIENKIPKVVIGSGDPFKHVAGEGIRKLQAAGIEVITDVLRDKCLELNKRFFMYHNKKRPYIILKWAQTLDGFVAREDYSSKWISNPYSRLVVHKWRAEEDAIFAGTNTVFCDDPQLTSREMRIKNPVRIVLDKNGKIPSNYKIFDGSVKTIVLTGKPKKSTNPNTAFAYIDFAENAFMPGLMDFFYEQQFLSVFVEGGATLINTFLQQNIWDEARVFTSNTQFTNGIKAPDLPKHFLADTYMIKDDILNIYRNKITGLENFAK
ncbi:MAG: bifunctional diaminohydroxyphosphoribosylaminopyrimidine deaminase/5-amino-6-(5-phosphoribosylamino)uracil reductase RibD [Bacteroidia bacterium]